MEIIRIYNNNVAVVRGTDGKEMIVIGKGLVFQKRAGDLVDESRIEKRFTLQNPKVMTKLEELIKDMPSIYLSISEAVSYTHLDVYKRQGLADAPVIAVPTPVGYGASFHGISALLTMLNSCANGISVVNIDNGYGAGYLATQINRLAVK